MDLDDKTPNIRQIKGTDIWVCTIWCSFSKYEGIAGPWWMDVLYWEPFYFLHYIHKADSPIEQQQPLHPRGQRPVVCGVDNVYPVQDPQTTQLQIHLNSVWQSGWEHAICTFFQSTNTCTLIQFFSCLFQQYYHHWVTADTHTHATPGC